VLLLIPQENSGTKILSRNSMQFLFRFVTSFPYPLIKIPSKHRSFFATSLRLYARFAEKAWNLWRVYNYR